MKTPTNPDRLLAAADRKYTLTYVGVALLLVVAIVIAGDEIRIHLAAIETWISGLGPWGIVAFVALYVAATTLVSCSTGMPRGRCGTARGFPAMKRVSLRPTRTQLACR